MAEEKAQAQRRLLRVTRRRVSDKSEIDKRRESIERRKEELVIIDLLLNCITYWLLIDVLLSPGSRPRATRANAFMEIRL